MNWADTIKANGNVTARQLYAGDANVNGGTTPVTWDPYEVWLTRIKQPRERAARGTPGNAVSARISAGQTGATTVVVQPPPNSN
jgi:hypothetical protein